MPELRELQPSVDRLTGTFGSLQPVKMGMMENPYSDYSNLTNEFGTPLDTAISFMNEMPEETFSESLKKRKKIFLISIILLIICTATIITYFNYLAATTPIYIDQVTYIYNDTEISYSTEILDTEQFN